MQIRKCLRLELPAVCLTVAFLLSSALLFGQDTAKIIPDGTDGSTLILHPVDPLTKKLPPNEFDGSYSTFKLGLGYIGDAATYSQDAVFKQQMDSAGLDLGS